VASFISPRITHGFDEDLNRAMKAAARALLDLVVTRHGLSRDDAYCLISVAADFAVPRLWTCARACTA
jgi:formamidase